MKQYKVDNIIVLGKSYKEMALKDFLLFHYYNDIVIIMKYKVKLFCNGCRVLARFVQVILALPSEKALV